MKCPFCGARTKVIETRRTATGAIRRRRQCVRCEARITTHETRTNAAR